jgi:uncharacterized membrane protein
MSKSMIQTFFPANYQYVTTNESSPFFSVGNYLLNEIIFPDDVATMCPEVVINIYSYRIRQPILAMNALFGLIIGFKCGYDLWTLSSRKKMQQQLQSSSSLLLWSIAYITFGIMNLSAIPLHCLLDAPTSTYPDQNPILWSIDTYMTGTSSICLLMASVEEIFHTQREKDRQNNKQSSLQLKQLQKLGQLLQAVGIVCLVSFWISTITTTSSSLFQRLPIFALEDWYLLPPLLAGSPILYYLLLLKPKQTCRSMLGHSVFLLGTVTAALSIVLDKYCCYRFGSTVFDTLTASTGVFFACDACFLGLYLVLVKENVRPSINKKE